MLERFDDGDGLVGYRSLALGEEGASHLFTTRRGGLDAGEMDGVQEARVRRAIGVGSEPRIVHARQVHGARVYAVDGVPDEPPAADALVTERPDRVLLVFTADCVPVLLASRGGRRVAAVHAGWRGLVAGIIPRALDALGEACQVAAIGPCLSLERFEVGPEVAAAFAAAGLADAVEPRLGERPHVDLRLAARLQLERAGVATIDSTDRCTWDDDEDFYSYRRDVTHGPLDSTGRLGAFIAPTGLPV